MKLQCGYNFVPVTFVTRIIHLVISSLFRTYYRKKLKMCCAVLLYRYQYTKITGTFTSTMY
jgi:hypothetical protein